jgi:MoaA/NifB/PqqE/SkfB family radical SAM enzyme
MFKRIGNIIKKIVILYKRFIKPNIQNKRYKKITKLFGGITKFILFRKPYILIIETGTICNLDCPTCPTPREIVVGARTARNMDFDSFKKIIDNSYKSFSAVLLYWSNEPLLNKDIAEMVRYCNSLNLYTFISTNVMLFTEKITKELIESGLDELLVCVDGFSSKTYERFRKGAKFEIVKRNIETICKIKKELKSVSPWIEIQYIETKQNSEEIASCWAWAEYIGVDGFRVQPLYITRHLNDFVKLRDEFYTEKNWQEKCEKDFAKTICKNADSTVCVLINGQLTICCYDIKGAYSYGNLLVNSFNSIEKNKKYIEIKKKGERRELSICKKC